MAGEATQGNDLSVDASLSADGGFVAFRSAASNLVTGDTNGVEDVFIRDGGSGKTERVSVGSSGGQANGASRSPSVSTNGRFVAFESDASNLVGGDNNAKEDVFVHDPESGATQRLIGAVTGSQASGPSRSPSVSPDGRYVAFISWIVPPVGLGRFDVFVWDRASGTTDRVSLSLTGGDANGHSSGPSVSGDGRYVAFVSAATNLVPGGNDNGLSDVFVRDRVSRVTTRISGHDGTPPNGNSWSPSVSADGRFVAFGSIANNMVPNDSNDDSDVFVFDRVEGTSERVSVASDGGDADDFSWYSSISADGRYVAFDSYATNLVPGGTLGRQIFVRDRVSGVNQLASFSPQGTQGNLSSTAPSVSGDGRFVAFESTASNLVADDTNGKADVFVRNLGPAFHISPSVPERPAGQNQLVHASSGVSGDVIAFAVIEGPSTGVSGTCLSALSTPVTSGLCLTDPEGRVSWTYTSSPENGTDRIRAFVDIDRDGQNDPSEPTDFTTLDISREPIHYVALGDSFSAGEGVGNYFFGTDSSDNKCHRSKHAYSRYIQIPDRRDLPGYYEPNLWQQFPGALTFGACSMARIRNVVDPNRTQYNEPRQLDYISSPGTQGTQLLTIGIGGNDAGFSDGLVECYLHACLAPDRDFRGGMNVEEWFTQRLPALADELSDALAQARDLAGADSSMMVLGYPFLFPATQAEQGCAKLVGLRGEMDTLRALEHQLNEMIRSVAAEIGGHYVSVEEVYAGHEVCGSDSEWINGPVWTWRQQERRVGPASFHPQREGYVATADTINQFVEDWIADGKPLTPARLPANPPPQPGAARSTSAAQDSGAAVADPEPSIALTRSAAACAAGRDALVPGQTVTVSGTDWRPGGTVRVAYLSAETGELVSVNVTASGTGSFTATLTMPTVAANVLGGFEAEGADSAAVTYRTAMFAELNATPGPCAAEDLAATSVGTAVVVPILANDTGGPVAGTVELTDPAEGTATANPTTGAVTYTPQGDFTGIDTFTYKVCDSNARCDTADVAVAVNVQCTITGTEEDDALTGTAGNDVICGLGGDDRIEGRAGNDVILGGPGTDQLFGGPGNDTIFGGAGDDFLNGGPGTDRLDGGTGDNQLLETDDEQPPTITVTTPAEGGRYPLGSTVTANYACTDNSGGIGVARCGGSVAQGDDLNTSTAGTFTFRVDAIDWAGNASTRIVTYQVVPP